MPKVVDNLGCTAAFYCFISREFGFIGRHSIDQNLGFKINLSYTVFTNTKN